MAISLFYIKERWEVSHLLKDLRLTPGGVLPLGTAETQEDDYRLTLALAAWLSPPPVA